MDDSDGYVFEESTLNPVSLYAELKVKFENYIISEKSNSSVCSIALRFSECMASPRIRFASN